MNILNLSKALSPLVTSASTEVIITEQFKVVVLHISAGNQVYNARVAEYSNSPDVNLADDFFSNLFKAEYSPEAVAFVANVAMLGWDLKDDDGDNIEFTPEIAIELMNNPHFGYPMFRQIVLTSTTAANFKADWEETVIKN
jgi:hypothetical protein